MEDKQDWEIEFDALTPEQQDKIRRCASVFSVPLIAAFLRAKDLGVLDTGTPSNANDTIDRLDAAADASYAHAISGVTPESLRRLRKAIDAALPPTDKVEGNFLKASTTARGFGLLTFTDRNGTECTLQESSLATEAAIWLGAAKLEVKRFPGNYTGWHDVDFAALLPGQDIVGNERMHLTQDHVRSLLPALRHFVETGELPTNSPPHDQTMPVPALWAECAYCKEVGEEECLHPVDELRWNGEQWCCEECGSGEEPELWQSSPRIAVPAPHHRAVVSADTAERSGG